MASYGRKTPINSSAGDIASLESTYGIDLDIGEWGNPVSANRVISGSYTIPSGHFIRVFLNGGFNIKATTGQSWGLESKDRMGAIYTAGQHITGSFYYLLYKVGA